MLQLDSKMLEPRSLNHDQFIHNMEANYTVPAGAKIDWELFMDGLRWSDDVAYLDEFTSLKKLKDEILADEYLKDTYRYTPERFSVYYLTDHQTYVLLVA